MTKPYESSPPPYILGQISGGAPVECLIAVKLGHIWRFGRGLISGLVPVLTIYYVDVEHNEHHDEMASFVVIEW